MAFDETKDVTIKEWGFSGEGDNSLNVSLKQYNGGKTKLQIGPRAYKDKSGEVKYQKAGRLSMDEVQWLGNLITEHGIGQD